MHATEPVPDGEGRRRVSIMPRHLAGLVAVYERHGEGRAGIEMYFTGRQTLEHDPYRTTSPSYLVLGS